jgi:gliding motility-associated-like protein
VTLVNQNGYNPSYTYACDFGDGTTATGPEQVHDYLATGTYLVTLHVTSDHGCENTSQAYYNIVVFPQANAQFSAVTSVSEFNPEVGFNNESTFSSEFWWDIGDGNTSTTTNPEHTYQVAGDYVVILIATNMHGCADTTEQIIQVKPEFTFYVPNVFTPDGDGVNDAFFGAGTNIEEVEMMVFDRWGELIFTGNNMQTQWDGSYKGNTAKEDVYVYRFKVKDFAGRWHTYEGHVALLK